MPWFWGYIFKDNSGWHNIICRIRNHPNGTIYYDFSYGASEPDYRCKDCKEYLQ